MHAVENFIYRSEPLNLGHNLVAAPLHLVPGAAVPRGVAVPPPVLGSLVRQPEVARLAAAARDTPGHAARQTVLCGTVVTSGGGHQGAARVSQAATPALPAAPAEDGRVFGKICPSVIDVIVFPLQSGRADGAGGDGQLYLLQHGGRGASRPLAHRVAIWVGAACQAPTWEMLWKLFIQSSLTCKDNIAAPNIKSWIWQTQGSVDMEVNAALHSYKGNIHHLVGPPSLVNHNLLRVVTFSALSLSCGRVIVCAHHYRDRGRGIGLKQIVKGKG